MTRDVGLHGPSDPQNGVVGPGEIPSARLADTAYFQLLNRPDRAKRVVVRRNFGYGGKPVVFKFRPTVNKQVIEYAEVSNVEPEFPNQTLGQSAVNRIRLKRVPAPWLPFYSSRRITDNNPLATSSMITQVYTDIRHYGLVIAMAPRSCTDGNLPLFTTKTYFEIEFRAPRLAMDPDVPTAINRSYMLFSDTLGDGQ